MRYQKFEISNFKGIRNAVIELDPFGQARVYSLVGLNESGKTTILEAIHSFSPDADTQIVVGSVATVEEQRRQRVPKDKVSDFTGDVLVAATLVMDQGDKEKIVDACEDAGFDLDPTCLTEMFKFTRTQRYKNGDFVNAYRNLNLNFRVRSGRQRSF